MNKKELEWRLEEFLKENENPYVYRCDLGADFKGFHSDSWVVGGLTGGSCWGSNADQSVTAEEEPDFNQLDLFLEKYYPKITFLQYKKLAALVKVKEFTVGEYYGNYTEYRLFYVSFDDIIEAMAGLEL